MVTYIALILFLFFVYIKSENITDYIQRDTFEKRCMIAYVIILAILAALKYVEPGTDMEGYAGEYNRISDCSFSYIFEKYPDNYGYYIASKFFSYTGLPYHFWFALVEIIYFGSILLFIYRFSSDRLFSMLLTFTISVFDFSLRGSKQTFAMGFTVLALLAFVDKKYIRSAMLYFVAFISHPSCLVFLVCPLMHSMSKLKSYWFVIISGASISLLFSTFFLTTALSFIESEHYTDFYLTTRSKYSNTTLIYYAVIFIFGVLCSYNYRLFDKNLSRFFIGTALCCVIAQSMSLLNKDFFRLAYYFIPFLIVFPANAFKHNENGGTYKALLAAMTIFYCLYVSRDGGYHFMWQQ